MRTPPTVSTVPYGADETIYIVVDGLGQRGSFRQQREVERTQFDIVVDDLMAGQFHDPIRVVAFNTLEHWSMDVSNEVRREILCRCDIEGSGVPLYLAGFMEMHVDPPCPLRSREPAV